MLDTESGIEVYIDRPSYVRHEEYQNPPGASTSRDSTNTKYIEASTDQEYIVCISLPPRRRHEPVDWVTCISIHIDEVLVIQKLVPTEESYRLHDFSRADGLGHNFSFSFVFGRLFCDPCLHHTEQQDIEEIAKRGKITVCIQRGIAVACQAPKMQITVSVPSLATTHDVMRFRSHGLKYITNTSLTICRDADEVSGPTSERRSTLRVYSTNLTKSSRMIRTGSGRQRDSRSSTCP